MDYKKSAHVDEYITGATEDEHRIMQTIRNLIFQEVPDAVESFENGAPMYELEGVEIIRYNMANGGIDVFIGSKDNSHIRIKNGEDVPEELIIKLLAARYVGILTK